MFAASAGTGGSRSGGEDGLDRAMDAEAGMFIPCSNVHSFVTNTSNSQTRPSSGTGY